VERRPLPLFFSAMQEAGPHRNGFSFFFFCLLKEAVDPPHRARRLPLKRGGRCSDLFSAGRRRRFFCCRVSFSLFGSNSFTASAAFLFFFGRNRIIDLGSSFPPFSSFSYCRPCLSGSSRGLFDQHWKARNLGPPFSFPLPDQNRRLFFFSEQKRKAVIPFFPP